MLQTIFQPLLNINWLLFTAINAPAGHTPLTDTLMPLLANDALYLFPLLVLFLWWLPGGRSPATRAERSLSREAVIWSVAAVILALVINVGVGALINEPRPFVAWPHQVHPLISHSSDASFPSDHAAVSFAIAGVLLIRYLLARRAPALSSKTAPSDGKSGSQMLTTQEKSALRLRTGILATLGLLVGLAIGYARIYVGVHYPLDILGGAFIGLLAAWIIFFLHRLLQPVARLAETIARPLHLA
jgi:undecaprenyl-diphosphatase